MGNSFLSRLSLWRPGGTTAGILLGLLAAVTSGLLVPQGAPPAYGICAACHGRDLLAGLGLSYWVGPGAIQGPVLTTAGLWLGAAVAAKASGEYRRRAARHPLPSFLLGLLTMPAALLALGCTARLILRVAYGDRLALWPLTGVTLAILAVTGAMTWQARRTAALTGGAAH